MFVGSMLDYVRDEFEPDPAAQMRWIERFFHSKPDDVVTWRGNLVHLTLDKSSNRITAELVFDPDVPGEAAEYDAFKAFVLALPPSNLPKTELWPAPPSPDPAMVGLEVEAPGLRQELLRHLDMVTRVGQQDIKPERYAGWRDVDSLKRVVDHLHFDTGLAADPTSRVGVSLRDADEADAVARVVAALDRLPETAAFVTQGEAELAANPDGTRGPDTRLSVGTGLGRVDGREDFAHDPVWAEVVAAARAALAILGR